MSHRLASRLFTLALLVSPAAVHLRPTAARADEPQAGNAPVLTIEEAIDISKRCVLERNVRVVGSFIESAHFERNPRGDRGPFWRITWAHSREIKGGQVFVSVFADRACEVAYGE
jgi:hypothetical protein